MIAKVDGRWAFVSRRTRRPLAYWRGRGKPPQSWVNQQERRVQYFKRNPSDERGYRSKPGGWTAMEAIIALSSIGALGYGITQYKPNGDQEKNKLATSALMLGGLSGLLLVVTKASNAIPARR
jgi:hypothetical protein